MSTKTSIKRIATVAAVALTLGGFSAVSAHATLNADALSVASATATGVTGTKATAGFTTSFIGSATNDSTAVSAVLISAPATNVALPTVETTTVVTGGAETVSSNTGTLTNTTSGSTTYVTGTFNVALTASVAGTYVVKLVQAVTSGGSAGTSLVTTAPTITFTITAAPSVDAASSTSVISAGTSYAPATAGVDDTVLASKSASQAGGNPAVAVIKVTAKNSAGTDLTSTTALSVTVAGSGLVATGTSGSLGAYAAAGRAVTGAAGSNYLTVFSDGTPGVGTFTISAGTTVLATETVTFYGAAAKFAATVTNAVVTTAAAAAGTTSSPFTPATPAYKAIKVLVTDAAGNPVAGQTVYANSDNTAVVNASYLASTASSSTGYAYFNIVGVAAGTANISFTNRSSASDTTTEITAPAVAIRVGSSTAASVKMSFDSSSYNPGAAAVVTVTVLDSKGLPVADGVYSAFTAATTSSLAILQGTMPGTAATGSADSTPAFTSATLTAGQVWVKGSTGTATFTVNMPLASGDVTFSGTSAIDASAVTATATVGSDPATQAAIDAAQEATDAANAAYDAANNAMDSADAATAAAQDASDNASAALAAVTSLSATVAKLVQSVASLATALAAIKKKLGVK